MEPPVARSLGELRRLLRADPRARRVDAVEITSLGPGPGDGAGLHVHPQGGRDTGAAPIPRPARAAWEAFAKGHGFPVSFAGDRRPGEAPAWTASSSPEPGLTLQVSPESFVQANRAANQALVEALLQEARLAPGGRLVDLFCGAGNFALPFARRGARTLGVESNPFAVQDAEANAREAGAEGARFLLREAGRAEAEDIRDSLGGAPGALLLDPPRKGALETIPLALALAPRRILYVSCNPATFARDARELHAGGYRIEAAYLIPMFPNTAHAETLTSWSRAGEAAPEVEPVHRPPLEDV
ncbi:MAG: methyltransferase domain-containing protein [Nitrospinota bacterium]